MNDHYTVKYIDGSLVTFETMWIHKLGFKFYCSRGQVQAILPSTAVKTKSFMAVTETIRKRAGLQYCTEPMLPPSDTSDMFIEVNVGSALAEPKFIYSDREGQPVVLKGAELAGEFVMPVKFFISISKILKKGGKFMLLVEDAKEEAPSNAINFDYEDKYTAPRYSKNY